MVKQRGNAAASRLGMEARRHRIGSKRLYITPHPYDYGIDLQARTLDVWILSRGASPPVYELLIGRGSEHYDHNPSHAEQCPQHQERVD